MPTTDRFQIPFLALALTVLFAANSMQAQPVTGQHLPLVERRQEKCNYNDDQALAALQSTGAGWGYGYADLLLDIQKWQASPYVIVDSIGASVQGRALWQLTITSPSPHTTPRHTVFIHARTHPGEVQSWWVANGMIEYLLSDEQYPAMLREQCVFYIIPMYNPDGVELESPRHNANDIDLEREWDKDPMEPEAAALKKRFTELMISETPIEIALNLHSAYLCERYFVYHDATGTSPEFALLQQKFIGDARMNYPDGIQPWDYYISWVNETPTHFPESWFWYNYNSDVMALTYEDMNCSTAGDYNVTAQSILHGVGNYLGLDVITAVQEDNLNNQSGIPLSHTSFSNGVVRITVSAPSESTATLTVHNATGNVVAELLTNRTISGTYTVQWDATAMPAGPYFIRLRSGNAVHTDKCVILH